MAVGTRTAPAFTAAVNERLISLHLIDASGDLWTQGLSVPIAEPAAEIEAYAAAYAAATQASLYGISDMQGRFGDADASNAGTEFRAQVEVGINNLFKDTTVTPDAVQSIRLVAPILEVMQGFSDTPLLSATEMTALIVAALAIMPNYTHRSAQYTARRERKNNTRVVT